MVSEVGTWADSASVASIDPAAASVLAASIAAFAAVFVYFLGWRQSVVERKRHASAEAIADALAWLELPYRVRRRADDSSGTIDSLANRFHHLQERLLFHENWLRVELPPSDVQFRRLVDAVKHAAGSALQEAWIAPPASTVSAMDVGDLGLPTQQVDSAVRAFTAQVRSCIAFWRFWT